MNAERILQLFIGMAYLIGLMASWATFGALAYDEPNMFGLGLLLGLLTPTLFVATHPLLRFSSRKGDEAYLYFLGASGGRMLLFLGVVGYVIWQWPVLRHNGFIVGITALYLLIGAAEVWVFLRNLRRHLDHP